MLFATNRVFNEGPTPLSQNNSNSRFPRSVNFKLKNNQAEQSIYFCRRNSKDDYTEIGHNAFFDQINEDSAEEILFYIHGYSNLPESPIFDRAMELQKHFDKLQPNGIRVIPLIWPCDNDFGILKDYFDDQIAADASDIAFMRFFQWYFNWLNSRMQSSSSEPPIKKNLHLLAHSMGARVLRGALNRSVQFFQFSGFPLIFRNIFLSAPDLVDEALETNQEGMWIPFAARNVVVYYASDDRALQSSLFINFANLIKSKRLGQRGPENFDKIPSRNVFALDCGDFNNKYDPIIGHGYFASAPNEEPGAVLRHMQATVQKGRVPSREKDSVLNEDENFN